MTENRKSLADFDDDYGEEIEIIEVVGLEDDPATVDASSAVDPADDDDPGDAIELTFDDEPAADPASAGAGEETRELRERMLRMQAEFENFKKRTDREKHEFFRHAVSALVERLLPVVDNFDRALAVEPSTVEQRAVHEGVALIHRQLLEELRREGLESIEAVGEPFDPERHEAVATEVTGEHPPNTVIEELQRGYMFQDRLLRPAGVLVSMPPGGDAGAEDGEES